jgi:hypothetical protein
MELLADGSMRLAVGPSEIVLTPSGVVVNAPRIDLN